MARALLLAAFFCFGVFSAEGSEVFSSADLMESGSWAVSVYGRSIETKPKLHISGTDAINVPVSGGNTTIFSNTNADIELEQQATEIISAFELRPREGLKYRLRLGQVRDFDLDFSSGSQVNTLTATKEGFVWGFDISGRIVPGSIVSTAISWSLGFTQTHVSLDRLTGGSIVYPTHQKFRQEEYQGAVNFSRRWKMLEPFGGLKIIRRESRLTDDVSKLRVSGYTNEVSPFVGLMWTIADKETLTIEGSFLDEESVTAGLKVQF